MGSVFPEYTARERVADGCIHVISVAGSLVALTALLIVGVRAQATLWIVSLSIYGLALVATFSCSAGYNLIVRPKLKAVFRRLDHAAIFLMIAGTYTPFTLGVLRGTLGWTLFGLVWGLALAGVVLTAAGGARYPKLRLGLYLAMGWLIVIAVKPLWLRMPSWGLLWLFTGGIAYTAGVAFYAAKRVRYSHFVWHLFVIAGTACHFIAVLRYSA